MTLSQVLAVIGIALLGWGITNLVRAFIKGVNASAFSQGKAALELGMRLGRLEVLICGLPKADIDRLLDEIKVASDSENNEVMRKTVDRIEKEVDALLGEQT